MWLCGVVLLALASPGEALVQEDAVLGVLPWRSLCTCYALGALIGEGQSAVLDLYQLSPCFSGLLKRWMPASRMAVMVATNVLGSNACRVSRCDHNSFTFVYVPTCSVRMPRNTSALPAASMPVLPALTSRVSRGSPHASIRTH